MANQNTVAGLSNYPVTLSQYLATYDQVLYAPLASGIYPSLPSPLFPLSTPAFPTALYIAPSPDIAGGELDGHPFEIKLAAKFTTTAPVSITLNMYQVTGAVLTSGNSSAAYTALTGTVPTVAVATFTNSSASIGFVNTFTVGTTVQFSTTGALPTNFAPATNYYVVAAGLSGTTFEVSATPGGTAIVAGSAGTGTQSVAYPTAPSGVGISKLVTGTATAANSTSGTIVFSQQYIWDSISRTLSALNAGTTWQKGVSIVNTQSLGSVSGLNFTDLNFIPSFTFSAVPATSVFTITELSLNRI